VNNSDPPGLTVRDCDWTGCAFNSAGAASSLTGDDVGSFSMGGISFTGVFRADEAQNESEYNTVVQAAIAAASQAINANTGASSGRTQTVFRGMISRRIGRIRVRGLSMR
jgi:hypothetical protein